PRRAHLGSVALHERACFTAVTFQRRRCVAVTAPRSVLEIDEESGGTVLIGAGLDDLDERVLLGAVFGAGLVVSARNQDQTPAVHAQPIRVVELHAPGDVVARVVLLAAGDRGQAVDTPAEAQRTVGAAAVVGEGQAGSDTVASLGEPERDPIARGAVVGDLE